MNKRTPIAFWVLCASALVLLCSLGLPPMLARPTNCGGNSAVLAACRAIVLSFQTVSLDRGGSPVSITNLSGPERECFRSVTGISSLPGSRLLVAVGSWTNSPSGKPGTIVYGVSEDVWCYPDDPTSDIVWVAFDGDRLPQRLVSAAWLEKAC